MEISLLPTFFVRIDPLQKQKVKHHFRPKENFRLGAVQKGRPHKRGKGVWSNADTSGQGVKDLADVLKMALFRIVSAYFADTPYE